MILSLHQPPFDLKLEPASAFLACCLVTSAQAQTGAFVLGVNHETQETEVQPLPLVLATTPTGRPGRATYPHLWAPAMRGLPPLIGMGTRRD